MLAEKNSHPWLRKLMVLLLVFSVIATYMPHELYEVYGATKASVRDGRTLEGSDGRAYKPNQKGGGYYWAKFSNQKGDGFVYRQARAISDKKTIVVDTGKTSYIGYCLEHGAWMNAGNTGYSAEEQDKLMDLKWFDPYTDDAKEGMELALLFGRQPNMKESDVPVKGCNLDDWYWATQNIIWEFQQGVRTSVEGGTKSYGVTKPDYFYNTVKGRNAGKIYNAMLKKMKLHKEVPSFTTQKYDSKKNKITSVKAIKMTLDETDGVWRSEELTDKVGIDQALRVMKTLNEDQNGDDDVTKNVTIKKTGANTYIIESKVEPDDQKVWRGKKDVPEINRDDMLAWSATDGSHYQTLATGADDPVNFYFRLTKETPPPEKGEPPIPEVPAFTFDVEKMDKNPGFDQGSGTSHTGMGDAPLDSEITLYVDGEAIDTRDLDVNGYSDSPFEFMPWGDISTGFGKVWTEEKEVRKRGKSVRISLFF